MMLEEMQDRAAAGAKARAQERAKVLTDLVKAAGPARAMKKVVRLERRGKKVSNERFGNTPDHVGKLSPEVTDRRDTIIEFIEANPGATFRQIVNMLPQDPDSIRQIVVHDLKVMLSAGLIEKPKRNYYMPAEAKP